MLRLTVEQSQQLNHISDMSKQTALSALNDLKTVKFMDKKMTAIDVVLEQLRKQSDETIELQLITAKLANALNDQQSDYQGYTQDLMSMAAKQARALGKTVHSVNDMQTMLDELHRQIPKKTDELSLLYNDGHEAVNNMYQGLSDTIENINATLAERGGREVQFTKLANINRSLDDIQAANPERETILLQFYAVRADRLVTLNKEITALTKVIVAFTKYLGQLQPTIENANAILDDTLQTVLAYNPSSHDETSDILKMFEAYTGDNPEKIAQAKANAQKQRTQTDEIDDDSTHDSEARDNLAHAKSIIAKPDTFDKNKDTKKDLNSETETESNHASAEVSKHGDTEKSARENVSKDTTTEKPTDKTNDTDNEADDFVKIQSVTPPFKTKKKSKPKKHFWNFWK